VPTNQTGAAGEGGPLLPTGAVNHGTTGTVQGWTKKTTSRKHTDKTITLRHGLLCLPLSNFGSFNIRHWNIELHFTDVVAVVNGVGGGVGVEAIDETGVGVVRD
jgi:hypothetical protein